MTGDAAAHSAVLLVGHGTISDPRDTAELLSRIRHGREAPQELVREVASRYARLGPGGSPLLSISRSLAEKLSVKLGIPCHLGMRFWHPLVSDVLNEIGRNWPARLCVLPLAPYSVSLYVAAVRELSSQLPGAPPLAPVRDYGTHPALVAAHANAIKRALSRDRDTETALVLTAHSLPVRVIASGDRYAEQFEASARAVAAAVGFPAVVAYQSVGASEGEWLGPNLFDVVREIAASGKSRVVVAPVGFLADHLETLYDLDVELADFAKGLGLELVRVRALNDDDALVDALASVAREALS
jgi:ferrochelatase